MDVTDILLQLQYKFTSSQRRILLKAPYQLSSASSFLPYIGERAWMTVVNYNDGKGNLQEDPIDISARDFLHTWLSFYGCYRYFLPGVVTSLKALQGRADLQLQGCWVQNGCSFIIFEGKPECRPWRSMIEKFTHQDDLQQLKWVFFHRVCYFNGCYRYFLPAVVKWIKAVMGRSYLQLMATFAQ